MRVAIYARKSTEEHQHASIDVQLGEARRFCEARGWTIAHDHIYVDSGVSGAEMRERPALTRMQLAASRKAFDVLVTRDESRVGRDMFRVGVVLQDLVDSGVRVFYYFTGEEAQFTDAMQKAMFAMRAAFYENERQKISERVFEHFEVKARKGLNVGGVVYGYDNVPVYDGNHKVHTDYAVNAEQAAIVREVFARYASGEGLRRIAHDLNARGVPSPHAGRRGTGSWSPSSIHDMLRRDRYRGVLEWGKASSVYRNGTRVAIVRPESDRVRADRPELAIVDADTWRDVAARLAENARGTMRTGKPASYLLSGIARCGLCGGPMTAERHKWGSESTHVYQCSWSRSRGQSVCTNRVRRPVAELDGAIIGWLRSNVLRPKVVDAVIAEARAIIEARESAPAVDAASMHSRVRQLSAEIARIATAIATTDAPPETLTRMLAEREASLREVRAEIAAADAPRPATRWAEIEKEARRRVLDVGAMLRRNASEARAALQSVLRGPIQCEPVLVHGENRYRMRGEAVLVGVVRFASPGGTAQNYTGRIGAFPFEFLAEAA